MTMKTTFSPFGFVLLVSLSNCGPGPEQESYEDQSKTSTFRQGGSGQKSAPQLVTIPISVDYGAFGLLGTAATSWSITMDSDPTGSPGNGSTCLSQYTATVTEANTDGIEVYKDDRNCVAKLTTFTIGGTTYGLNTGSTDFSDWSQNDTAIFSAVGASTDIIRVKVISQLGSPITGTEAVVYNFSEILDGSGDHTYTEADVSDPHAITVQSQEAPLFDVVSASFQSMNDASGAPEFIFTLKCVVDPTVATPVYQAMTNGVWTATDRCGAVDLADISYKLVKDTYASTLNVTDAETIFSTAGESTITQTADQITTAGNHGFVTKLLAGPGGLGVSGNENMILILKSGLSFTYYNIDVTTIVQ